MSDALFKQVTATEHLELARELLGDIIQAYAGYATALGGAEPPHLSPVMRELQAALECIRQARQYVTALPDRGAREQALNRL